MMPIMPAVKIEEIGWYEWIEVDERGRPKRGMPAASNALPSGRELMQLYIRLSGNAGSYWLTIDVENYLNQPEKALSFESQYVSIPRGGETHLIIPFSLDQLSPGSYTCVLALAGRKLGRFGFVIG